MQVWSLRQGADRRIRSGHPWIFSNELSQSPKGTKPGTPIMLTDNRGQFLAHGYGNPNSLIAFRALSFNAADEDAATPDFVIRKVLKSWWQRKSLGYTKSFRLIYGEGDFLPGLVIDRYLVRHGSSEVQVFAVQILTYGMSEILSKVEDFFTELVDQAQHLGMTDLDWSKTAVVIRNDVNVRKLEGLNVEAPKVLKAVDGLDLTNACLILDEVDMFTDLIEGQKTGFFLDQAYNIELICRRLENMEFQTDTVKVLDLCCYVGQWSTKIVKTLKNRGLKVEVTAVDVSAKALAFAEKNISNQKADTVNTRELDVLNDLGSLPERYFDIVIADPPAFIKAKKDVPTGKAAYLKMNTWAFKLVKSGGLVVSCSCSGLFIESEMMDVLRKASQRGQLETRCINHGGHSADHPVLLSFNEGFYLKMFVHQVLQA